MTVIDQNALPRSLFAVANKAQCTDRLETPRLLSGESHSNDLLNGVIVITLR